MLYIAKFLVWGTIAACLAYAAVVLFPMKLRILRRVGFDKNNAHLLALADAGDADAAFLKRRTRLLLWIAVPCACVAACMPSP